MKIRIARPEDFDCCVDIVPQDLLTSRLKARLGYLIMSRSALLAVEDDNLTAVIGFGLVEHDFFDDNGMYLRTVVVKEDQRNSKVGSKLLEAAVEYAKRLGARRLFFDTYAETEEASKRAGESSGFKPSGYIENMHDEGGRYNIYSLPVFD